MKNLGLYLIYFGALATSTLAKKWEIHSGINLSTKLSRKKSVIYHDEEAYVDTDTRQVVFKYNIEGIPHNMTFNYLKNEEVVFEQKEGASECSFEAQKIAFITPYGKRKGRNQFIDQSTMKYLNDTDEIKPEYDYEYYRMEFKLVDCKAELRTEVPVYQKM